MIFTDLGQHRDWEYDVRAITSSFFPGEEISSEPVESADTVVDVDEIAAGTAGKNDFKKALYRYLARLTGKELPWGILTGIRPTKITSGYIAAGMTPKEAAKRMQEEYLVGEKKAVLSAGISETEAGILSRVDRRNTYSLYIGIPFCPTTCLYCSFTSYPLKKYEKLIGAYLDALYKEIDRTAELFRDKICLTVYIGGGTPTTLTADQLGRLIDRISERIDLSHTIEFTVECGRPDSISIDKLRALKERGVTRISVNPQTMNDRTLELIGRKHNCAQIIEAYDKARSLAFGNINMDIILGLPGEGKDEVARTVEEITKLAPDALTVHALAVKRASRLKMEAAGAVKFDLSPEEADEVMDAAAAGAANMGLIPYYLYRQKNMAGNLENVGFSKPGAEGLYNILIMEEIHHIVALGAGTVTKAVYPDGRIERTDNVKTVEEYIARIDEMIDRKRRLFDDAL